jgi:cephalosporin-C deacetylase-like acetyl esterase
MHEPDNYGLSDSMTMLQVGDATPPPGFVQYWSDWASRAFAITAALTEHPAPGQPGDPGAAGVTHTIRSLGDVRIGVRLIEPDSPPRAIVISAHGYALNGAEPLTDDNPWTQRNLAVLKLRLRGYPGSCFDTGDLVSHELGYVTHGINDPREWILAGGVADIVAAVRAAREHYGPSVPVMLHGESFGGGLAVIAASQLAGRIPIARIALGLPSLGWWQWRLARRPHAGIGFEVRRYLDTQREHAELIITTLKLFDAMTHARRVTCPLVCKIAERDDVVPAPTAAAVYNAIASDPGLKWRFVTRYGHFDGGLADLRRHAMFEMLIAGFLDPAVNLAELMRRWEPLLVQGDRPPL